MADFNQHGLVTTLHDLGTADEDQLEALLEQATQQYKVGLVLPVTAADMRARPFARIIDQLEDANYIDQIVVRA